MFHVAGRVVVDGFGSRPDLNKREGVVVNVSGTARDDGRCGVLVDGETEAFSMKMSNLRFVCPDASSSALTDHRCFGCDRTEAEGEKFSHCPICRDLGLPKSRAYFCGTKCQKLHWTRHKAYHNEAKASVTFASESVSDLFSQVPCDHPALSSLAAYTNSGDPFKTTVAAATRARYSGDTRKATRLLRKAIGIAPDPDEAAECYLQLGNICDMVLDIPGAVAAYEKAYASAKVGTVNCARALVNAFKTHIRTEEHGRTVPRPSWWTDKALLELSEPVAVYAAWCDANDQGVGPAQGVYPDTLAWSMRGRVLAGMTLGTWTAEPRSAAQLREAAIAFMCASKAARVKAVQDDRKDSAEQCMRWAAALEIG